MWRRHYQGGQLTHTHTRARACRGAAICLSSGQSSGSFKYIMAALFPGRTPITAPVTTTLMASPAFVHTGSPRNQREVSKEIAVLKKGTYVLIPFTFYPGGCYNV